MNQHVVEFTHPTKGRQSWLYDTPEAAETIRRLLEDRWIDSYPVVKPYEGTQQA